MDRAPPPGELLDADGGTEPGSSEPPLRVRVLGELNGRRADEVILRSFSGLTRREVKRLFQERRVRLHGRPLQKGDRLQAGAELTVAAPPVAISPDASIGLELLFESDDFVIVNKPAGLPTAPLVRTETRSLAAALLARYPEMWGVGFREREPGLVHRLDNETSGVVLSARNQPAFLAARALIETSGIEKRYLALVSGARVDSAGEVETLLGPDSADPRRVRVVSDTTSGYAKLATTRFRVLEQGARFTLLEVTVERAFRHQIRAHLAHLGAPIAGDQLYGGAQVAALGARHALHASYIAWAGDSGRAGFRGEAGLPDDLRALLGS